MEDNQAWPIPVPSIPVGYCYNPTNLNTTVVGSMVLFSWDSPHDNDGFYLTYTTILGVATQVTVFGISTYIALLPNTVYTWSVRTMCNRLTDVGSATVLGVSFNTTAESIVCPVIDNSGALIIHSSINTRIQWTNVEAATYYKLQFQPKDFGMITEHTSPQAFINLTTLNPNTEYLWRVKAICSHDEENWSGWASFKTGLGLGCPAVKVSANFDITTGIIYWTPCAAAKSYQVYVNGSILTLEHPVNVITVQRLLPKTDYTIIVIPNCEFGPGDMALAYVTTRDYAVANPLLLAAGRSNNSDLLITWQPAVSITGQEILINGSLVVLDAEIGEYRIKAHPDTKYSIVVRSVKNEQKSTGAFINFVMLGFCLEIREVHIDSFNHNSINISWAIVAGTSGYKLRYSKVGTSEWITKNVSDPFAFISGLQENTEYIIEVTTVCANATSESIQVLQRTSVMASCPLVKDITFSELQPTSVNVNFLVDGYKQESLFDVQAISTGNPTKFGKGTRSPIPITNLLPDTLYRIKVINDCGLTESTSALVTLLTPKACTAPPTLVGMFINSNTQLSVSWGAVTGIYRYGIKYRPLYSDGWIMLPNQTGTSFVVNAAVGIYEIAVSSIFSDGRVCTTQVKNIIPKVLNVQKLGAGAKSILSWSPINGVDYYAVDIQSLADEQLHHAIVAATDLFLLPNTAYSVTVQAVYNNVSGTASDVFTFTTDNSIVVDESDCKQPTVQAFRQDSFITDSTMTEGTKTDIMVVITDYDPNLRYKIQLIAAGNIIPVDIKYIEKNDPSTDGSVLFIKKAENNNYSIIVTSVNDGIECSTIAVINKVSCSAPTTFVASVVNDISVTFTWAVSGGAVSEGFIIYKDGVQAGVFAASVATLNDLTPSTQYKFVVRAMCANGIISGPSNELTVTTQSPL